MPITKRGTSYIDKGEGKPLLLLHGWCMDKTVWQQQISALCENHRVIAPDLAGHGDSVSLAPQAGSFAEYAAEVIHLAEQLNLHEMTIIGWSMGAQVLLKAYQQLQRRVSALVLIGATPCFTKNNDFPFGLDFDEVRGMGLKLRRNQTKALDGFLQKMFAAGELDDPQQRTKVTEILANIKQPATEAALNGLDALMTENLQAEAVAINCPALVIHGASDTICLPQAGSWLADKIDHSRFLLYENCGHAPFLSNPLRFNNDLLHFLGKVYANS